MIALLPLIVLLVRRSYFSKMELSDLPLLTEQDLSRMKRYSNRSVFLFLVFTLLSILPYAIPGLTGRSERDIVNAVGSEIFVWWSYGVTAVGLVIAGMFDLKAEKIKRGGTKAEAKPKDRVRWFHILVAVLAPMVGVAWGAANLIGGKPRSGKAMLIISVIVLALLWVTVLSPRL